MKFVKGLLLLLALALGVMLGAYFYNGGRIDFFGTQQRAIKIEKPAENVAALPQPMPPRYVVEPPKKIVLETGEVKPELPLPIYLDEGDHYLKARLPQLIEKPGLIELLALEHFIQKLVLVIDQLPEKSINRKHLPINPPEPGFRVSGGAQPLISKKNAVRYQAYVKLAEAIPDEPLLRLYRGLYPLFQQAYQEMGYADRYFNDRLIEVLDHLLETPEPEEPIALVKHINRYKYADPKLEALSAGQKILLRMGRVNAQPIKQKLQAFRTALVSPAEPFNP